MVVRFAIVAALVGIAGVLLWHPAPHRAIVALTPSPDVTDAPKRPARSVEMVVYVAGAVRRPGLYRLHEGDRYDRAVTLAGGFRSDADAAGVNLAQRAADGEEVLVPRIGEAVPKKRPHQILARVAAAPAFAVGPRGGQRERQRCGQRRVGPRSGHRTSGCGPHRRVARS